MQIGDRVYKPLEEYDEQGMIIVNRRVDYARLSLWCRDNSAFMAEHDTYYEATMIPAPSYTDQLLAERAELQAYLNTTDWIVVKCMERGLDIKTEYPEAYENRGNARTRIEEIDKELEEIDNE